MLLVAVSCGGGNDEEAPSTPTPTTQPTPTQTPSGGAPTATPTTGGEEPTLGDVAIPEPFTGGEESGSPLDLEMIEVGGSGQSGTAIMVQIGQRTKFEIEITPNPDGTPQRADIHRGRCDSLEEVDLLLFDIEDGHSISMIKSPLFFIQARKDAIVVHDGDSEGDPVVACADIPTPFG